MKRKYSLASLLRVISLGIWMSWVSQPAFAYVDEINPSLVLFSGYKQTYYLFGTSDHKIELSFKAQGIPNIPLYFAYTQLMFWDVYETSAPFRDINYNPEFFYRLNPLFSNPERWLDVGFFEHESNGRAGDDSRSWNRAYLRFTDTESLETGTAAKIHWSLKAWIPYAMHDNPDIAQYRGYWEATVSASHVFGRALEKDQLTLRFNFGGQTYMNPLQGAQELTYQAKISGAKYLPLWTIQLFHGFGESMLTYRSNTTYLRAGIGF